MSAPTPVSDGRTRWTQPPRPQIAALLDVDPDLGRGLTGERLHTARSTIPVRLIAVARGAWAADGFGAPSMGHLGMLVVDGVLGRELLADDVASLELLGPGDILRPWDESADPELVQATVRWSALAPTLIALLDHQFALRIAAYPEIHSALLQRFAIRTRQLAMLQAISQLNRVDRRLLTLLWHLAERWGHVTPDGVMLGLALSHRMLGQLVGARRPTVSAALGELARTGEVARGVGGTWLLTGSPVGAPDAGSAEFIAPRRPVLARVDHAVGF
jgi:hypothetical protein